MVTRFVFFVAETHTKFIKFPHHFSGKSRFLPGPLRRCAVLLLGKGQPFRMLRLQILLASSEKMVEGFPIQAVFNEGLPSGYVKIAIENCHL